MSEFDPIRDIDPARPACAAAQAALQRLLDGESDWDLPDAACHRVSCVACREELALARSFSQLPAAVVPAEMAGRILNASVSVHRRRRVLRWAAGGLALAASVVIAVVALRPPQPVQPGPDPVVVVPPPKVDPEPLVASQKPLGDSVSEARDAFVSLTMKTATEPRDRISQLLPEPKMPESPDKSEGLEPLADAGTGAARSVEPLRDSAGRAVNFFLRAASPPSRNVQ